MQCRKWLIVSHENYTCWGHFCHIALSSQIEIYFKQYNSTNISVKLQLSGLGLGNTKTIHSSSRLNYGPFRVSVPGLNAVDRTYDGFPVGDGIFPSQIQCNDRTRAHEGSQAREEVLSVVVCIEVTALLWTELQCPFLLGMG